MITLATLSSATAQQVFDQVATHLLTQKKPAKTSLGNCLYRTSDGLKCAAGCLMADDEYNYDMENMPWADLIRAGEVTGVHENLITALQITHDSESPEQWKGYLGLVAEGFNLSTEVLEQF